MELQKLKKFIVDFLKDESGQTTTEYVLIMAVIFTLIMNFRRQFVTMMKNWLNKLDQEGQSAFDDNSGG